jgi:hypothetical protein
VRGETEGMRKRVGRGHRERGRERERQNKGGREEIQNEGGR